MPFATESKPVLPPLPDGAFTLVLIPDSQFYLGSGTRNTEAGGHPWSGLREHPWIDAHVRLGLEEERNHPEAPVFNPYLSRQIDWILAHLEDQRIFFVSHLGDAVERNREAEWDVAKAELDRLRGRVPWGISVGNHDMEDSGDASLFQERFPAKSFEDFAWYGGTYNHDREDKWASRDNVNSYQLISADRHDFLFLHLECNAPDDVLDWADGVLGRHVDRHALVVTHMDLGPVVKPEQAGGFFHAEMGRMCWKKVHGDRGNTPIQAWDKCYRKHANIEFIFSGDQSRATTVRCDTTGDCGNSVHALMTDYFSLGVLRLIRFLPDREMVDVIACDTMLDCLVDDTPFRHDPADHCFTVPWRPK